MMHYYVRTGSPSRLWLSSNKLQSAFASIQVLFERSPIKLDNSLKSSFIVRPSLILFGVGPMAFETVFVAQPVVCCELLVVTVSPVAFHRVQPIYRVAILHANDHSFDYGP